MNNYRLENSPATKSDHISQKVTITFKLYSLKADGTIRSCLGSNQSLDRLMKKNHGWIHNDCKYVIRQVTVQTHEEQMFKVIPMAEKNK